MLDSLGARRNVRPVLSSLLGRQVQVNGMTENKHPGVQILDIKLNGLLKFILQAGPISEPLEFCTPG